MTLLHLVTPLAVAMATALVVTTLHRRLPPILTTRMVSITLGTVLVAAVPTLWLLSLRYVTHVPFLAGHLAWCAKLLGVHTPMSSWLGVPLLVLTAVGLVRAARVVRSYLRFRCLTPGPVEMAEHERPFAYTLPGRAGRVVVSTGLVDLLDEREMAVVVAHEEAHARHRHDRFLLTAQLAVAVVPVLAPLSKRLQFTIERWADEAAAARCGDRMFVARTLSKVALHDASPIGVPAFGSLGVTARVQALIGPSPVRPRSHLVLAMWSAIAVTLGLAAVQLHQLGAIVAALCFG